MFVVIQSIAPLSAAAAGAGAMPVPMQYRKPLPILGIDKARWNPPVNSPRFTTAVPFAEHNVSSLGFSSLTNARSRQEDMIITGHRDGITIFGVADGHGGDVVARFLGIELPLHIVAALKDPDAPSVKAALQNAFLHADEALYANLGYYEGEKDIRATSGAVVTGVVMHKGRLYVVNTGDSRTLIGFKEGFKARGTHRGCVSEDGSYLWTPEHKVGNEDEMPRITAAQGFIGQDNRLNGIFDPVRSFGDFYVKAGWWVDRWINYHRIPGIKPQFDGGGIMTALPDVFQGPLERVRYVVCASDGVWDMLSPDFVNVLVHEQIALGKEAQDIAQVLTTTAIEKGSGDNVTAVVVLFKD